MRPRLVFSGIALTLLAAVPSAFAACGDGVAQPEELCFTTGSNVLPGATDVRAVLAVDLDVDGHLDVVAVTPDRVYVRWGTATGLGTPFFISYAAAMVDFRDVSAGDFNADGDEDVAVADVMGDRVFLLRTGPGQMLTPAGNLFMGAGAAPRRVFAAPIDFGPLADLVVFRHGFQDVRVLTSTGAGFMLSGTYPVGPGTRDVALGDVDADGWLDLVYANGMGTSTLLHSRHNYYGVFFNPVSSALPLFDSTCVTLEPLGVVAADFSGDGAADAAVSTTGCPRLAPAASNGDGTFTFQPMASLSSTAPRIRAFDADHNGTLDVLAPSPSNSEHGVQFGAGDATFPDPLATLPLPPGAAPVRDVAMGDFDGNGFADVLSATSLGAILQRATP